MKKNSETFDRKLENSEFRINSEKWHRWELFLLALRHLLWRPQPDLKLHCGLINFGHLCEFLGYTVLCTHHVILPYYSLLTILPKCHSYIASLLLLVWALLLTCQYFLVPPPAIDPVPLAFFPRYRTSIYNTSLVVWSCLFLLAFQYIFQYCHSIPPISYLSDFHPLSSVLFLSLIL